MRVWQLDVHMLSRVMSICCICLLARVDFDSVIDEVTV